MNELMNLKDMNLEELKALLTEMGEKPFRADQLARWLFREGIASFDEMTDLSLDLRARLASLSYPGVLTLIRRQISRRGDTIKYLFGLPDGQAIESVLMRHSYGQSACISTQVGCRMGCRFCASTKGGLIRNLTPGEIYDQVLAIQRDTGDRVTHLVLMGSGEPLDNLSNVIKFLEIINAPYGLNISYRHITLSTSGLVPQMKTLALKRLPLTLAVSLHAPTDELRDKLMPVNRRYPLDQLMEACREYTEMTGRRITFEYVLLSGINDSLHQAAQLARLLAKLMCHVNLIPANPVEGRGFVRTPPERVRSFKATLEKAGLAVTVRRELGTDIDAACGQLRRRAMREAIKL